MNIQLKTLKLINYLNRKDSLFFIAMGSYLFFNLPDLTNQGNDANQARKLVAFIFVGGLLGTATYIWGRVKGNKLWDKKSKNKKELFKSIWHDLILNENDKLDLVKLDNYLQEFGDFFHLNRFLEESKKEHKEWLQEISNVYNKTNIYGYLLNKINNIPENREFYVSIFQALFSVNNNLTKKDQETILKFKTVSQFLISCLGRHFYLNLDKKVLLSLKEKITFQNDPIGQKALEFIEMALTKEEIDQIGRTDKKICSKI